MALKIPKDDTASIATIKALPVASVAKFISVLASAPLISNPKEMGAYISEQMPSTLTAQLVSVLETIYTLYYIRELSGVDHPQFLEDLMDGIRDSRDPRLTPKDLPKLQSVLERILSIDTLKMIAKAARLQHDGERLYCSSKILSDMRPVFGEDPSIRPVGSVLAHTLKLTYHEGGDHKEFHVVLDSDDLEVLGEVVQRAQAKDKTLRELLKSMKLPTLDE
jgi:hypothetical protein